MQFRCLLLVAALFLAGAASAQGREGPGVFDRADKNGDGVVARDELLTSRAEQFASRDRNGDGFIDEADLGERAAARPRISQAMNAMITQLDTDKDGKLSKTEFVEGGAKLFDRADADSNGSLDAKELEAAKTGLRERAAR